MPAITPARIAEAGGAREAATAHHEEASADSNEEAEAADGAVTMTEGQTRCVSGCLESAGKRLLILRVAFSASDSTARHLEDKASSKQAFCRTHGRISNKGWMRLPEDRFLEGRSGGHQCCTISEWGKASGTPGAPQTNSNAKPCEPQLVCRKSSRAGRSSGCDR